MTESVALYLKRDKLCHWILRFHLCRIVMINLYIWNSKVLFLQISFRPDKYWTSNNRFHKSMSGFIWGEQNNKFNLYTWYKIVKFCFLSTFNISWFTVTTVSEHWCIFFYGLFMALLEAMHTVNRALETSYNLMLLRSTSQSSNNTGIHLTPGLI